MTLTTRFIMSFFWNALSVQTSLNLNRKPKQMKTGAFFCAFCSVPRRLLHPFSGFSNKNRATKQSSWTGEKEAYTIITSELSFPFRYQPPYIQKSLIRFLQSFDMPVFPKVRKQNHKFLNSGDSGPVVIRR